jgi:nickel-dependent lactate racemase
MNMETELRTGAWYEDRVLELPTPENWQVTTHRPVTPRPLVDEEIRGAIARPVGQARIRELCRGKRRPVVVVDDLNRPTPAARVLPFLLEEFRAAGIEATGVTIVMATGTHGAPPEGGLARKVGPEAALSCRLIVHDDRMRGARIGTTSVGTPVIVDREVAAADFLVGVGGIYPNYTAGYGGGAKLALGVLARRSIAHLHYRHEAAGWGAAAAVNPFRRDVEEAARLIGLETQVALQVDARREVIRAVSGAPGRFYDAEVEFARRTFAAPGPGDADVVISNTYPGDTSLTFVKMKGSTPLVLAKPGATRILVGSGSEGTGYHGLFPVFNPPRLYRQQARFRELSVLRPEEIARRAARKGARLALKALGRRGGTASAAPERSPGNPVWLYRPGRHDAPAPAGTGELRVSASWDDVCAAVEREQGTGRLKVVVYACAPLQWIDLERPAEGFGLAAASSGREH